MAKLFSLPGIYCSTEISTRSNPCFPSDRIGQSKYKSPHSSHYIQEKPPQTSSQHCISFFNCEVVLRGTHPTNQPSGHPIPIYLSKSPTIDLQPRPRISGTCNAYSSSKQYQQSNQEANHQKLTSAIALY